MIIVERFQDLLEDMETYKKMFPDTHVPYNRLKEMLEEHYNDPVGSIFGIQVATTWEDKCYGFEIDRVSPKATHILYAGVWKT